MFTLQNMARNVAIMVFMVAINKAGAPGNAVFFAILILWATRSSEGAFKAISLSILVLVSNEAFAVKSGSVFAPMRFVILFIAAGRLYYDLSRTGRTLFSKPYYLALLAFGGACAALAIHGGYFVHISLLKIIGFIVGTSVILAGAEMMRRHNSDVTCWFYSMIGYTIFASFVAWAAGVGYNAKTDFAYYSGLFNGPFYHPQTLGPACALMICYLVCLVLYTPYKQKWLSFLMIGLLLLLLYKSSSRTAVVAMCFGVSTALAAGFFWERRGQYFVRFNFSKAEIMVAFIALLFVGAFADAATGFSISTKLRDYMLKGGESMVGYGGSTWDALIATREAQIEMMLMGIKSQPLTGIGFGTSSDPGFAVRAGLFSAPTEKGFLPLAIVEETGLIGTAFFLVFLGLFYAHLIEQRNMPGLAGLTGLLGVNLGEMNFFSFGGQGSLMWLFVGAGMALGSKCISRHEQKLQRQLQKGRRFQ